MVRRSPLTVEADLQARPGVAGEAGLGGPEGPALYASWADLKVRLYGNWADLKVRRYGNWADLKVRRYGVAQAARAEQDDASAPSMSREPNITQLLAAWGQGDSSAFERLASAVHDDLHRLAARYMAGERPGHVLQPTALVNETYLRLVDWKRVEWQNRAHFFGIAAQMMRRILVDVARSRNRSKRGGRDLHVSLAHAADVPVSRGADLIALDDALKTLEGLNARHSRVVELRFFGGLSNEEVAHVLDVSVATVRRDWRLAQAWLYRELQEAGR